MGHGNLHERAITRPDAHDATPQPYRRPSLMRLDRGDVLQHVLDAALVRRLHGGAKRPVEIFPVEPARQESAAPAPGT